MRILWYQLVWGLNLLGSQGSFLAKNDTENETRRMKMRVRS